ncbi:MAG: RNA chaperone Hfq [Acidobacteria bacterium]|nr:MAG: RNA chaperone Hfq [Acidobacteriota bacterium]REK02053.1 MAG: RNA chaperone Hfq [Acidobacteriota bacterium]REK15011.1 MAG: RNA chaperone Hfq [Acidobacteriota bacterium]REK45725.1 MAG: RNA chaperone Hfq [Acidobacteriota bacterium]
MERSTPQNIQDAFLNTARREKQDVVFQLADGNSISGRIKSFDKFSVLIDTDGQDLLLFKHAISTISVEKKKPNLE